MPEDSSTGDGTCPMGPGRHTPPIQSELVVPGTQTPRAEGLHLPALTLGVALREFGPFLSLDLGWALVGSL